MAKLPNVGHEKFAQNLAAGMKQEDAFADAGYARNNGHASRLKGRPEVAARIAELKAERRAQVPAVASSAPVPLTDAPQTLAEMGYSKMWFADAYRRIAAAAEEQGQLNHAVTALGKIQSMYESEVTGPDAPAANAAPRIDIGALGAVLDKVAVVIAASKAPDQSDTLSLPDHKAHRAAALEDEA